VDQSSPKNFHPTWEGLRLICFGSWDVVFACWTREDRRWLVIRVC